MMLASPMRAEAELTAGWSCYPDQAWFLTDPGTYLALTGGWGSGKSMIARRKGILCSAQNPGSAGMIVLPTYRMLRDLMWRQFQRECIDAGVEFEVHKSDMEVYFPWWDHLVMFRSADRPERLEGHDIAWAIIDEADQTPPEIHEKVLSRVRDPKAARLFYGVTGTPAMGWLEPLCDGPDAFFEWRSMDTRENLDLPGVMVDALVSQLNPRKAKAYLAGQFVDLYAGQCYDDFDAEEHVRQVGAPTGPIAHLWDFNVDPACSAVGWHDARGFHVLDEFYLEGGYSTPRHAEAFVERWGELARNNGVSVYGDYSGVGRQSTSGLSDWALIENAYRRAFGRRFLGLDIAPNPPVPDRINAVNAALRAGRCAVDPRCENLILDLRKVAWDRKRRVENQSDIRRTHLAAALGYWIYSLEPVTVEATRASIRHLMAPTNGQRNGASNGSLRSRMHA